MSSDTETAGSSAGSVGRRLGRRQRWIAPGVVALLVILVLQLALSISRETQTWDEACHIYAGYRQWTHLDFGLNPEHPPLVKFLATAPLLGHSLKVPSLQDRFFKEQAFLAGRDFLYANHADWILFRVRMAASLLTVLLGLLIFAAGYEMFGTGPAFVALALFVFEPTVLAHGAMVTTDMGMACFLFATVYAFYRYLKKPTGWRLAVTAIAAGLTLATKHSGILLPPILMLLALVDVVRPFNAADSNLAMTRGKRTWRLALALILVGVIAVGMLWASYGFRYQARPEGDKLSPPLEEYAGHLKGALNAGVIRTLAHWRLLPESYLYGLADVKVIAEFSPSYLLGHVYRHGVWFYFPIAFVIKATLALLFLLFLLPVALALRRLTKGREVLFLAIPAAIYLAVGMASELNIGVRHMLPVYPSLVLLGAAAGWSFLGRNRIGCAVLVALMAFNVASSAPCFPAYFAHSNELWGGPSQTYRYLSDSNADWGQQLKTIRRYLEQRKIQDCWFVYFADIVADYRYYGIPCKPLPTIASLWLQPLTDAPAAIDGTVLISASTLSGYEFGPGELNPYIQFQKLRPVAVIDYGVFVYDGHFEVPLAAALNHAAVARRLFRADRLAEALAEAQAAAQLAPNSASAQAVLGEALRRTGRKDEAHEAFQRALILAQTVQPEYQAGLAAGLQRAVAQK